MKGQLNSWSHECHKGGQFWLKNPFVEDLSNEIVRHAYLGCVDISGRNYQVYKHIFQFEEYLTTIPHSQAIIIFKLRTNNNKFPVETGRWKKTKTPLNERYCTLCNSGDIGDLYHYLFIPIYM